MQTLTPQKQFTLFTDRELVRLIFPIIVEQLLFITVGMADTMMIASQGDASVSGVSLVDMVNIFIGNRPLTTKNGLPPAINFVNNIISRKQKSGWK